MFFSETHLCQPYFIPLIFLKYDMDMINIRSKKMGLIGFGATEEFVVEQNQGAHEYGRKNPVYEFSVSISLLTLDIFNHTREMHYSVT